MTLSSITREHLQYGIGALASLAVIAVFILQKRFDLGMGAFALGALGVAGYNDLKNSPPKQP